MSEQNYKNTDSQNSILVKEKINIKEEISPNPINDNNNETCTEK